ncbi:MAG: DUF5665 domain-containing protein [candidate division WOR-3 bacterium]|nr:DUF5665 domain-containing protein [candidate division WOR-3 bacterium]
MTNNDFDNKTNPKDNEKKTNSQRSAPNFWKQLDVFGVSELITFLRNPTKVFFINLLAGIGRGLGFALGMTILAALVILVLRRAVNAPVIGAYIAKILEVIDYQRQMYR